MMMITLNSHVRKDEKKKGEVKGKHDRFRGKDERDADYGEKVQHKKGFSGERMGHERFEDSCSILADIPPRLSISVRVKIRAYRKVTVRVSIMT